MKNLLYTLLGVLFIAMAGCEKMNDKHDKYLADGEIIYVGTVDSIKVFPGNDRIKFRYWIGDPRVKTLMIYWSNMKESFSIPVEPHAAADSFDVFIDVAEGNHTFQWISFDDNNPQNKSITFEKNANVYGSRFQSRITNKIVSTVEISNNDLTINWAAPTNTQEIGVNITYTQNSAEVITEYFSNEDLLYTWVEAGVTKKSYFCTLTDVDFTKGVTYNTLYIPEETAIDTFYTAQNSIEIIQTVNVAENKPVTAGSFHGEAFLAEYAVDGDYSPTDSKRWISGDTDHWLEIDLLDTYEISSFSFWNGASSSYQLQGLTNFKLQAWIDDDWVDLINITGNDSGTFSTSFTPVSTDKVKFVAESKIRFYEIAIYSTVRY